MRGLVRGRRGSLFCEQEDGGDVVEAAAGVGACEERAEGLVGILAEAEVLGDFGLGDHVGESVGAKEVTVAGLDDAAPLVDLGGRHLADAAREREVVGVGIFEGGSPRATRSRLSFSAEWSEVRQLSCWPLNR